MEILFDFLLYIHSYQSLMLKFNIVHHSYKIFNLTIGSKHEYNMQLRETNQVSHRGTATVV